MDLSKHLQKAEEAIERRNFAGAFSLLWPLLRIEPNNQQLTKLLLDGARRRFQYQNPSRLTLLLKGHGYYSLGVVSLGLHRYESAANSLLNAALVDPTKAKWLATLGYSLEQGGKTAAALDCSCLDVAGSRSRAALRRRT